DIIMVGEIRDLDTAETCCKAALTGHLVLSTVHTNDAPSAIGRLIDLGLKPYLISASMLQVIAQRLVRKICANCKVEVEFEREMLLEAGFTVAQLDGARFYRGTGCDACAGTGFMGRNAIFEIMPVTRKIKTAIATDLPADQIKDIALGEGMKDLRHAALEKVLQGLTTLEEAIQNTLAQE
ncbi:MAG TPA: ATPase, T2SS/T4P/T4SS family, partial [Acidobacteriota bacterium]|nr:ATPase, T2SS/T4P/T4SS family [Acidobacteriota bacterium]